MEPGYKNAVVVAGTREETTGYAVENGNDEFLPAYYEEHFRKELDGAITVEQARELLAPSYEAIKELGYNVGPIETKSHKDWCVEVFGTDPDEYEKNRQAEDEAQTDLDALDAEYDDYED